MANFTCHINVYRAKFDKVIVIVTGKPKISSSCRHVLPEIDLRQTWCCIDV